jgi:hypothetical protein
MADAGCGEKPECRLKPGFWWRLYTREFAGVSCYHVTKRCRRMPAATAAIEREDRE